MNASAAIFLALAGSLAVMMFVIGLRATRQELSYLPRHPALWLRSALVMSVLVPLLALWITSGLGLRPAVSIGLFSLALSPVPLVFPVRHMWGEGRDAYPVSLVTFASALGLVVAPLTLPLLLGRLPLPPTMVPSALARILWIGVLLPWVAGVLLRPFAPVLAPRAAELLSLLATGLLLAGLVPLVIRLWPTLSALIGDGTIGAVVVLAVVAALLGHVLGGPVPDDRRLLACAAASRHPGMAIVIAWTFLRNDNVVIAVIVLGTVVGATVALLQAMVSPRVTLVDHRTMRPSPSDSVR